MMQKSRIPLGELHKEGMDVLGKVDSKTYSSFATSFTANITTEMLIHNYQSDTNIALVVLNLYESNPAVVNILFEALVGYSLNTILESTLVEMNLLK